MFVVMFYDEKIKIHIITLERRILFNNNLITLLCITTCLYKSIHFKAPYNLLNDLLKLLK